MTLSFSSLRMFWHRDGVRYGLIAGMMLIALTLFLLANGSANTALFARNYPVVLGLTAALVLCLLALVGYQLLRLRRRLAARVFGARLTLKLVWQFALIAVLPGLLVYGVSVQFVSKSIESWFDVRVEKALEGGLNLGQTALEHQLADLRVQAGVIAKTIGSTPTSQRNATLLESLRVQMNTQQLALFDADGWRLAVAGAADGALALPSAEALREAHSTVEVGADQTLYLRVFVPVGQQTLQVLRAVPTALARDAQMVQDGQRDYQELTLARRGLHWLYALALTLTLLLALLTALLLAFTLSERLSEPLSYLAEGTRAVAQGDFSQHEFTASEDELGMLTQSFNEMRQQLAEARVEAERHQAQLAQAQRDAAWSEVARRLAHEIKNPLTPIQLSAERLQTKLGDKLQDADADLLARSTQTIINQVAALKHMVDAFRQYARLPELALQQIDFAALLREVMTLYEPLGIRFEVGVEADLPRIAGDPAQLRQVMHNLLQNAQDALTGVTNPRIVVRAEGVGSMLRVSVTDNGSGFPEALMQRVFEPYATTKPKGTGLGLVIVKKIIEEHGGTVQIENASPRGARVTLTLPFVAAVTPAQK